MGRNPKYNVKEMIKACEDYERGYGSFDSIARNMRTVNSVVRG